MKKNLLLMFVLFFLVPVPFGAADISAPHLSNEIEISNLDNEEYHPDVAYNGKHHEYLVVWRSKWSNSTCDIRAARISDAGQVLSSFIVYKHSSKDSAMPSVAYDSVNDRYLVVWIFDSSGSGTNCDLYGRFIPWDGPNSSLHEFAICQWNTSQLCPTVAYNRAVKEFLVVWHNEYQAGTPPMYISGRRINAADGSFPGGESDLTISHLTENRVNPDVIYNRVRNEYIVVYDNNKDIFGIRLTGDLRHNFGGEFGVAGWPSREIHPAVAVCPESDQYMVVWQSEVGSGGDEAIYSRFLNGEAVPGHVTLIDNTTSPEQEADVTCNLSGTQYLVTWQTRYTNLRYGIWGRLVRPDEMMDPQFLIVDPGSDADRTNPITVAGHANYLVAWEHQRNNTAYQDIYGRLIAIPHAHIFPWPMFLPAIISGHK